VFQAAGLWEKYRQDALGGKEFDTMPEDAGGGTRTALFRLFGIATSLCDFPLTPSNFCPPCPCYTVPVEDIVAKQTLELQSLASSFREHSVENVLEISNLGDEISRWGAIPDRAQTLIPQLCRFLSNINEVGAGLGVDVGVDTLWLWLWLWVWLWVCYMISSTPFIVFLEVSFFLLSTTILFIILLHFTSLHCTHLLSSIYITHLR
jgi:hypothetical protein